MRQVNLKNLILSVVITYIVTALHHAYGAWFYETPWRNHIVSQGLVWLIVCLIFLFVNIKWKQKWAYWVFFAFAFFFFFGAIGLFEGLYNHVLKNILYFGELPEENLFWLFPQPKYSMPDNFLFEISGILSFVVGAYTGYMMIQYSRLIILKKSTPL